MKTFNSKLKEARRKANGEQRGFTLIEMMVSVGLFAVVMLISTAVILSIINGNRKSQTINNVVNNLNFSIESMIRDMKTGYWYVCDDYYKDGGDFSDLDTFKEHYFVDQTAPSSPYSCLNASLPISYVTFVSTLSGTPQIVEYYFVPADTSANTQGTIYKTYYDLPSEKQIISPLTTPDINIDTLSFYVNNPPPSSTLTDKTAVTQPSVFLVIKGNAKIGSKDTDVSAFNVQTYISQRLLNI